MKSMMEEASSVFKAIENCWSRAGKPEEFTVKILELPQKNFLGITTKAAKIALFFNQPASSGIQSVEQPRHKQPRQPQQEQTRTAHTQERQERREHRRPEQQPRPAQRPQQAPQQAREDKAPHIERVERVERRQDAPREYRSDNRHDNRRDQRSDFRSRQNPRGDHRDQRDSRSDVSWNQEMVDATQEWLKETLVMMDQSHINVHANYSNNFLKVELSEPVDSDVRQEEVLFKSWTNLIFEVLREKFKTSTRGLRLVIESRKKV
ncbi:hypothetical protein Noda2021_12040 [Candidatus Dependentiae bacterium Noda2021]|nr:hypothetical protein Noda2021_12040 [Candidatus Dependentiae bacterium Noda2021]